MKGTLRENIEKTTNGTEKAILEYLDKNASSELREKIQNSNKDIKDCIQYIASEVKAKAVGGCACVTDAEVFGLAVHYFEEDSIGVFAGHSGLVGTTTSSQKVESKPEKKEAAKKVEKKESGVEQLSMFDLFEV